MPCSFYSPQLTATSSAEQIWCMRPSLRRPILSTKIAIDTLSIESRLTAQRRLIGSSPGSRTTSLGRLRIVVVHGAINVRRNLGMAASREITTTGLRWISGNSHHQTSPRSGTGVTRQPHQHETQRGCPTHRIRQLGTRRTRRRRHQSHPHDCERRAHRVPRQAALRHLCWNAIAVPPLISLHLPLCLLVPCSCHNHSINMPVPELRTRVRFSSPAPRIVI